MRPRSSIAPATARARWHPPGRRARHWGTAYAFVLPVLALTVILFPLVVTSSEKLMMVSQGLTIFEGTISKVSYNLLMAGSLIAVVPVLVVALVVQRRVVEGLTLGAIR